MRFPSSMYVLIHSLIFVFLLLIRFYHYKTVCKVAKECK